MLRAACRGDPTANSSDFDAWRGRPLQSGLTAPFFLVALLAVSHGWAADAEVKVHIEDYGIYKARNGKAIEQEGVAGGQRVESGDLALVDETDQVPDEAGTLFGFHYQIDGSDEQIGKPIQLKFIIRFPYPGVRPDSQRGEVVYANEYTSPRTIGDIFFRGYAFDRPWEIALGEWSFQIWSGDTLLAEKKFNVYHQQ